MPCCGANLASLQNVRGTPLGVSPAAAYPNLQGNLAPFFSQQAFVSARGVCDCLNNPRICNYGFIRQWSSIVPAGYNPNSLL